MRSGIVVFLGPTLPVREARGHLDAIYLPPAGRGDMLRAMAEHTPRTILLIDGVFAEAPGVRHQEILFALSRGVEVHGASSMGALRAAELASEGMHGHGMIYRWYRRFPLADDADVAVPMAPSELGSARLGDPLIDIRVTLRRAERTGVITKEFRLHIEGAASTLHFRDRSYALLLAIVEAGFGLSDQLTALKTWLKTGAISQKRSDAIMALQYLRDRRIPSSFQPENYDFKLTEAFGYDMKSCNLLETLLPEFKPL